MEPSPQLPKSDAWREKSLAILRDTLADLPVETLDFELFQERETWSTPYLSHLRTQVFRIWRPRGVFEVSVDGSGQVIAWESPERAPERPSSWDGSGEGLDIARPILPEGAVFVRRESTPRLPAHLAELIYKDGLDTLRVRVNLATRQTVSFERRRSE